MDDLDDGVSSAAPFLFAINACFTVMGRGTVAGGEIVSGVVRRLDVVELVHSHLRIRTKCLGVEVGHGRKPDGTTFPFLGLWLAGVRKFDVIPGDYVSSPGAAL